MIFTINEQKRSFIGVPSFKDGYTIDFFFVLRDCFKPALDIKKEEILINGKKVYIESQGQNYDFHQGDAMYNCLEVYTMPWGKVPKDKFTQYIQVLKATPAYFKQNKKEVKILNPAKVLKGEKEIKTPQEILIKEMEYDPGEIEFKLFTRDSKTKEFNSETIKMTQKDFVLFLKTGIK